MSDRWTDSLSDYLDEELEPSERGAVELHLRDCGECAATLAALRRVVGHARSLSERAEHAPGPDRDLWPAIAERIAGRPPAIPISRGASWSERRVTFSVTQLAAACVALAVISGAAVWYARTTGQRDAGLLIPGSAPTAVAPAGSTAATSSAAVEELRQALANGQDELDPVTVRTLEESLMIIDVAIQQARRALDADPRNPYVRAHLDETMRRKVDLLHRATMLASAPR